MNDDDLDAIERRRSDVNVWSGEMLFTLETIVDEDVPALIAEVRRLREALDIIAGSPVTYLQSLKMTDTEYALRSIAREALGQPRTLGRPQGRMADTLADTGPPIE